MLKGSLFARIKERMKKANPKVLEADSLKNATNFEVNRTTSETRAVSESKVKNRKGKNRKGENLNSDANRVKVETKSEKDVEDFDFL